MKDFLKFTFASVIGVILAGVVFTILGIITLVGIVASSDTETVVKDNSIFVLDFKGSLSERVQENPLQQLLGEEFEAYGLDDILASIKKAKDNDKIKGIYTFLSGNIIRFLRGNTQCITGFQRKRQIHRCLCRPICTGDVLSFQRGR